MRQEEQKANEIRELTRAEEQIMQVLWDLEKGMIHDILGRFPEPRPAYNTVSTIVRILEQKGFIGHKAYGRTHEYFPLIEKKDYTRSYFRSFISNYFSNSFHSLASFFTENENLSIAEMEEIKKLMDEKITDQKKAQP
jgi:BlaI family penicillinase repressor